MQLELNNLVKIYPFAEIPRLLGKKKALARLEAQKQMPYTTNEGVLAVRDLSLTIEDGEFLVLLGESGCGKSSLLRMIAGLEDVTAGSVVMDGQDITSWLPEERDMAMIFQNYSLYPHFTVYENIAFPLKNLHIPRQELDEIVRSTAALLGLEKQLDKLPDSLSGGQLQRVAIGRAIVRKPKLFLMDEPFSNLDAPMRAALRLELKRLHRELGTTFVYVTHDQTEAFALGTRIAVMKDGALEQVGTPQELYNHPVNRFVASFLGQPAMNFIEKVPLQGSSLRLLGQTYPLPADAVSKISQQGCSGSVTVGIRPVNIELVSSGIPARVAYCEPLGSETIVHLDAGGTALDAVIPEGQNTVPPTRGSMVQIALNPKRFHIFR